MIMAQMKVVRAWPSFDKGESLSVVGGQSE